MQDVWNSLRSSVFFDWAVAAAVFMIVWLTLEAIYRVVRKRVRVWTVESTIGWTGHLVARLEGPMRFLLFIVALGIAVQVLPASVRSTPTIHFGAKILLIIVGLWLIDRLIGALFSHAPMGPAISAGMRRFLLFLARVLLYALALLTVLDTVGISITPILASLGVGSIAVALALQDTLNNFFSGFYILLDRPLREGDFVRVAQNEEGTVQRIGWRSTRVERTDGNMVIVPNAQILSATILNYSMPSTESIVKPAVGVAYGSDLEKVERLALEVARELQNSCPIAVRDHTPLVRFQTFGESSINFIVVLKVTDFKEAGALIHFFMKALKARFDQEGIELPFPQRVVELKGLHGLKLEPL